MKRFLKTFFAFAAVIAAVVLLVNGLYLLREQENWGTMGNQRNDNAIIKDVPEKIQICNFGSSHGFYGFDYEELSKKCTCFNFGLPGQVPSYDYRLLQNYRENIAEGAIVFIPLSFLSFFGEDETESADFASKNMRYYRFLKSDCIKEYDAISRIWVTLLPATAAGGLANVAMELVNGPNGADLWNVETNAAEATEHGAMAFQLHVESKKDKEGNRQFNQEEINSIYSIIGLCKESGFVPVLVTTPFLDEYNSQIRDNDPAFYDDFYGVIEQIVEDTGARYYNYSVDERFSHDYTLFIDSDHLNHSGAEKFVSILEQEVLPELRPAR